MSKLYLGTDVVSLASQLAANLDQAARRTDCFLHATIVVPSHYLKKWLRLDLARRFGVAINLRFDYLETVLWELLRDVDPRRHPLPVELIDDDTYRLMILAVLLDEQAGGSSLTLLRDYLGRDAAGRQRDVCRRAWQLAWRLSERIRDYEFHRRDLILQWLRERDSDPEGDPETPRLERSQRRLFQLITREPDGLRAQLSRASGKLLKTLPQYAGEIMELPARSLASPAPRAIHIFGFTQISAFHHQVLRCLSGKYDLRFYHLNPLIGQLKTLPSKGAAARDVLQALARRYRTGGPFSGDQPPLFADQEPAAQPAHELLAQWGQAGAEGLWLTARLLEVRTFTTEIVPSEKHGNPATVLHRLQDQLLGQSDTDASRVPQDCSLQIVACPGVFREVETVYQSILHNLQTDPTLRQTDIGVLVTDMPSYRPVVQAVFERQPRHLKFNIANLTAAGLSAYGHGVLGLLDLALESFTRSRVFAVLLNPCFLARLGVDHEQALVWLNWAEQLGIYHSWDSQEKGERGYPASPWYSWQLGLRRLRLGRLMDAPDDSADRPATSFRDVIPFADLESGDKEQLDTFCRAVEGLLPRLGRLRALRTTGELWAVEVRRLVGEFLAVPRDRSEDQGVRQELFQSLSRLQVLDRLAAQPGNLPLSLIREFILGTLESIEGTTGEYLTGGVSIASLSALLPVPFRIVYVIGLGEGLFPGANVKSAFDLRSRQRCDGDVQPVEANLFLFLQALLGSTDKLYLLYNSRELQKDQEYQPCGPLNQLRRYLERHVLNSGEFQVATAPLTGADPRCLGAVAQDAHTDVFANYNETERLLAIDEARLHRGLQLTETQEREVARRMREHSERFDLPPAPEAGVLPSPADAGRTRTPTVALHELQRFLKCPAEAGLQRHLHLRDDVALEVADDEPFYTTSPQDYRLIGEFLQRFTARALRESADTALVDWRDRFTELHAEWRLRGRAPEEAFGQVDRTRFLQVLQRRIEGEHGLAAFIRARAAVAFVGPVLLGESFTPIGPRTRFPALRLPLAGAAPEVPEARLVGSLSWVWRTDTTLEVLLLTGSHAKKFAGSHLSLPLLEPLLFLLALKAGREKNAAGLNSSAWLGDRAFQLHIAHDEGITPIVIPAEDVAGEEAHAYLGQLAGDFLQRGRFDLLPFDLLTADRNEALRQAYTLPDEAGELDSLRLHYRELLRQAIDDDQRDGGDHPLWRPMQLLEIAEARVPDEAFDQVRRRFRLLDRTLARLRAASGGKRRGSD
jgi:exodeoxyribonuclease V gamma subunit